MPLPLNLIGCVHRHGVEVIVAVLVVKTRVGGDILAGWRGGDRGQNLVVAFDGGVESWLSVAVLESSAQAPLGANLNLLVLGEERLEVLQPDFADARLVPRRKMALAYPIIDTHGRFIPQSSVYHQAWTLAGADQPDGPRTRK